MLSLAQVQSKSHLSRDQSMPAGEPHNSASNVWSNCLIQLKKKHDVVTVQDEFGQNTALMLIIWVLTIWDNAAFQSILVLIAFVSCLERQEWRYIRNNFLNPLDVCNMVECVGVLLQSGGGGVLSERRRASPSLPLSSSEPGEFSFSLVPLKDYSRSRISAQILASWVSH